MRIIVALGGNALQQSGKPATAEEQLAVVKEAVVHLADLLEDGHQLVIVHGNGPQVGRLVLQNDYAKAITPAMPFDVCGAMSQGMIGYHIQQALQEELARRRIEKPVATVLTQVVVDKDDAGFQHPSKPIGPFYSKEEAECLQRNKQYAMVEDAGRGYRRVVASPKPKKIVELRTVKKLVKADHIVITAGGGGIPVVEMPDHELRGIDAVIDKDLAAAQLADNLNADLLLILTAVERVAIRFGKADQKDLSRLTVAEAQQLMRAGEFAPGSMLPKMQAAVGFVKGKPGRRAIIASLQKAREALLGKSGTLILSAI